MTSPSEKAGDPSNQGDVLAAVAPSSAARLGARPPSFEEVFRAHAPFAWRCLRRLGVRDGDADDVCQEVFLIVHRKLSEYDGRASMRSWIYGICVKKASDHRRLAHNKRERLSDQMPESAETAGGPDATLESRRALARLDRALSELDDDKRAAFVLYEIEGLPLQEVADACGCPLQTVYSRLAAARKYVEGQLADVQPSGGSGR